MAENKVNISLSIKEIDSKLCPECKKALRELIKEKLTDVMVEKVIT
jgi:uncharacterized protein with PIN domain